MLYALLYVEKLPSHQSEARPVDVAAATLQYPAKLGIAEALPGRFVAGAPLAVQLHVFGSWII